MAYVVASFSGGKDSTAMVLHMIELGEQLDEVITCDTGMEFPQMYEHIEKVRRIIEGAGIKYTTLRADKTFEDYLLNEPPTEKRSKIGMGWPCARIRWCTKYLKTRLLRQHIPKDAIQCVGLALDEQDRRERESRIRTSVTRWQNGAGPRPMPSPTVKPEVSIGADCTTGSTAYPAGAVLCNPSPSSAKYGNTTPSYGPGWRSMTRYSQMASTITGNTIGTGSHIIPNVSSVRPGLCRSRRH